MSFCPYCGTKLTDGESCTCAGAKEATTRQKKPGGFNIKKLIIPIVAVVLVVAIVVIALSSRSKSEFDLSNYIVIEGVSGLNGAGVVKYHLDEDQLMVDILNASTKDEVTEENFEAVMIEQYEKYEEIGNALSCITVSASQETGLSNGDKVIVSAEFENAAGYDSSFVLISGSQSYTVSGLMDSKTIDLFSPEVISVTFSGVSGTGEAHLQVLAKGEVMSLISYNMEKWQGLSNGDAVTVKAIFDATQLEKIGYVVPAVTEQTFTVAGLNEYLDVTADVPAELLQSFCSEVLTRAASVASTESGTITSEPEVISMYSVATDPASGPYFDIFNGLKITNGVAVITQYTFESEGYDGLFYDRIHVWLFPNLSMDANGNISYDEDKVSQYFAMGADPENIPEWFRIEFFGYLKVTAIEMK